MVRIEDFWPADQLPYWMPYFEVADCDASAVLAARINVSPSDIPPGRFAAMTDPVGARLVIIARARHHG